MQSYAAGRRPVPQGNQAFLGAGGRGAQYDPLPPKPASGGAGLQIGGTLLVAAVIVAVLVVAIRHGFAGNGAAQTAGDIATPAFRPPYTATAAAPAAAAPLTDPCLTGPCKKVYYMYRAQSDANYAMQNVNTGSLAGVMWYLHNEIVKSVPRKYDVTRVLRLKVTMMTTPAWWNTHFSQFAPYRAFDGARCTVPGCNEWYMQNGFVVGCQAAQMDVAGYRAPSQSIKNCAPGQCNPPIWYSLPGPCPSEDYMGKSDDCKKHYPGGFCFSSYNETTGLGDKNDWNVTGAWNCTYHVEWAGEVSLDELVGIDNYTTWRYSGMTEYNDWEDRGNGISFWDGIHNETACTQRMDAIRWAIHQSAQHLDIREFPFDMPEPVCDAP